MGQVGLNNLTFQEVAANGKSVQEMWLNGSQIYSAGDLWYGVRFKRILNTKCVRKLLL